MHWIQKHILEQLMSHETRRFSELRAEGVESNLFQYHLRHLITKKLVEKCNDGYRLAAAGLYYSDRYSRVYKGERPQPKLITVVAVKDGAGKTLLYKKLRQPWIDQLQMSAGKIHSGEMADAAARREIYEKVGVAVDDVRFRSVVHVRITKDDVTVSDFVAFVFTAYGVEVSQGEGEWHDLETAARAVLAPSVRELMEIESKGDGGFHIVDIKV